MTAVDAARAHAQALLRIRGWFLAATVLPAALAVVLWAGRITGRIGAPGAPDSAGWDAARWAVTAVAVLTLLVGWLVRRSHRTAVPPVTPAVPVGADDAPELHRLLTELAQRLEVPPPSGVALTPDCDSWLEEVPDAGGHGPSAPAPVLVIGSPFLWWMRADELRALLAPVVAGTAAAADPDIAAARRFVRGLDAALGEPRRGPAAVVDRINRTLLGACREHAAELERSAAAWASERARAVDYGLRIAAQEQVGLAYAGWDRLLTRVALPAWRLGRHPEHLNAGVVSALTELARRDRLADGYESRLGDRPACDLLEEPGRVDAAVSLLAAELLHEVPSGGWERFDWEAYPADVAERGWREKSAALHAALDGAAPAPGGRRGTEPALGHVLARLARGDGDALAAALTTQVARGDRATPPAVVARSGRDLLTEYVTAMVCCAAIDTGNAVPGLDWLDGPVLLMGGVRRADLGSVVAQAVELGKDAPLRGWLETAGIRLARPVRS